MYSCVVGGAGKGKTLFGADSEASPSSALPILAPPQAGRGSGKAPLLSPAEATKTQKQLESAQRGVGVKQQEISSLKAQVSQQSELIASKDKEIQASCKALGVCCGCCGCRV